MDMRCVKNVRRVNVLTGLYVTQLRHTVRSRFLRVRYVGGNCWELGVHGPSGCARCAEGFICSDKGVRVRQSVKCGHCRRDWNFQGVMVCKMLQEDAGRGKCAMVMMESRRCYDSYWGCQKGLKCMRGVCQRSGRYLWRGVCGRIAWNLSVPGRRYSVEGSRGLRTQPQIMVLVRWG